MKNLLEKVVEIFLPVDEIDLGGVDDEERGLGIAEEELVVRLVHRGYVVVMHLFFERSAALFYAAKERVRARLEEDDEVRLHDLGLEELVDLFVERELVFAQVEAGEDPVLGEQVVADRDPREQVGLEHLFLLAEPVQEEERLGLEAVSRGVAVEVREEGVVLGALEDQPGAVDLPAGPALVSLQQPRLRCLLLGLKRSSGPAYLFR